MEERTKQVIAIGIIFVAVAFLYFNPIDLSGLLNLNPPGDPPGNGGSPPQGGGIPSNPVSPVSLTLQLSSYNIPAGGMLGGIVRSNRAQGEVIFYARLKNVGDYDEIFTGLTDETGQYLSATPIHTPGVYQAYGSIEGKKSNVVEFTVRGLLIEVPSDNLPATEPFNIDCYTSFPGERIQIEFSNDDFTVNTWLLWNGDTHADSGYIQVAVPAGTPPMVIQFRIHHLGSGQFSNVCWVTFS